MKKLTGLVAILVIINLIGCGGMSDVNEDMTEGSTNIVGETEDNVETDSATIEDIDNLESIITDEASDSEDCAAIEDEDLKKTCEQSFIYKQAVEEKNKNICAQLENTSDQEMCVAEIGE